MVSNFLVTGSVVEKLNSRNLPESVLLWVDHSLSELRWSKNTRSKHNYQKLQVSKINLVEQHFSNPLGFNVEYSQGNSNATLKFTVDNTQLRNKWVEELSKLTGDENNSTLTIRPARVLGDFNHTPESAPQTQVKDQLLSVLAQHGKKGDNPSVLLDQIMQENQEKIWSAKQNLQESQEHQNPKKLQNKINQLRKRFKMLELDEDQLTSQREHIQALKENLQREKDLNSTLMSKLEQLEKEKLELERSAEEEIRKVEAQKELADNEKQQLIEALKQQQSKQRRAKEKQQRLLKKLKGMEERLVMGNQMIEQATRQEQELIKAQQEVDQRRKQEMLLERRLKEKEEEGLLLNQRFSSLQEEIDTKNAKLKKLWSKYQAASSEVKDLQQEFQREREDMVDTIRVLTQQLKLKSSVIQAFVPKEEAEKLSSPSLFIRVVSTSPPLILAIRRKSFLSTRLTPLALDSTKYFNTKSSIAFVVRITFAPASRTFLTLSLVTWNSLFLISARFLGSFTST